MSTTNPFACPACSREFGIDADRARARRECPECGHALTVPGPHHVTVVDAEQAGIIASDGHDDQPPLIRRRPRSADEDEVDMTPMVDVTFLLLIFFIMTAAFSLQKSIEIPPTKEEQSQNRTVEDFDEDKDFVVVRIDADNVFWVDSPAEDQEQEAPSEVELLSQLRAARTAGGGGGPSKLLVLAHGDARHEYVVTALDAGTAVGMEEVKLATMDE